MYSTVAVVLLAAAVTAAPAAQTSTPPPEAHSARPSTSELPFSETTNNHRLCDRLPYLVTRGSTSHLAVSSLIYDSNVSGYTMIPGDYTETTYQQSGSNLSSCVDACRNDPVCESIAYAAFYTECLFFDR